MVGRGWEWGTRQLATSSEDTHMDTTLHPSPHTNTEVLGGEAGVQLILLARGMLPHRHAQACFLDDSKSHQADKMNHPRSLWKTNSE